MGRKKRDMSFMKPFCFYCQKTFRNQVFLHQHQKAKHFTCGRCNKKFSNMENMLSHSKTMQNHEPIERVPNAIKGRESIGLKVFGMHGVPRVDVESWILKGAEKYWGKIVDEQVKKRKEEEKEKGIGEEQENMEKRGDGKKVLEMVQEKQESEEQHVGPISFELTK